MENKTNPNLSFVRPEHYNHMLELFVREKIGKRKKILYVILIHVIAFVFLYQCSVSLCPNDFSYPRTVIYSQ